jgi:hypothetical protein
MATNVLEEYGDSTFRLEDGISPETSVTTYDTTWCHNLEDHNLKLHQNKNIFT